MNSAQNDLKEIKSLMERSSRFISLSGLSGVFAGMYALLGAFVAHKYFLPEQNSRGFSDEIPLIIVAVVILFLSLITAYIFTSRNAKRKKQKIWDKLSQRMLLNLCIPLFTGGIFIIILMLQSTYYLIAPAMLLFYGLALINGSKYTLNDIRYLGVSEIVLGLLASWFYGNGLLFWVIGFGILHIIYGAVMYWKYER